MEFFIKIIGIILMKKMKLNFSEMKILDSQSNLHLLKKVNDLVNL